VSAFKFVLKMWRMDTFIRHKCGERENIVGQRCFKRIQYCSSFFFNYPFLIFYSKLKGCIQISLKGEGAGQQSVTVLYISNELEWIFIFYLLKNLKIWIILVHTSTLISILQNWRHKRPDHLNDVTINKIRFIQNLDFVN